MTSNRESPNSRPRGAYPGAEWERGDTEALGFDPVRLADLGDWQAGQAGDSPYRLLIVRYGRIAAEWHGGGMGPDDLQGQASASKSTYSTVLGIAIAEGVIGSADDPVADYYPEFLDVSPEEGPKENRYAFPENAGITFRQLIANMSGYMKPGETPGTVFNYQTFGMNVVTHALAARYSLYRSGDPERGAGFGRLVEWKVRNLIGGSWKWVYSNFDLHPRAKLGVYGYATSFQMTARDMARLGLLWLNDGDWNGTQVVPAGWLRQATRVSDMLLQHEPREMWRYGLGFWCNDQGVLWPNLPRDSFAAVGAGKQSIWVDREHDLIVVQSPGTFDGSFSPAACGEVSERVLSTLA
ncbi:MAG: serine hydrolase [Chloroflexi bacterium]|nr:serine hydrolase [Chloroflexota bacterium]